jgi:hypothetical protein
MARAPVIQFPTIPPDHHTALLQGHLERVIGRVSSHATIPLHSNFAGTTVTLAGGIATAPAMTAVADFADAGIDGLRINVFGTPPANDVTVQAVNLATGQVVATAVMKGGAPQGWFTGTLQAITPLGGDEQIQVRFIGTGAQAPVVNQIHLHGATLNLKP